MEMAFPTGVAPYGVPVLILLPPSEGKTAPVAGPPVDLETLSHPSLASARQRVGDALITVSGRRNALHALEAGPSLAGEVKRNRSLWTNPADAAARVYTGVLYDAAGMSSWDAQQLAHAHDRIRIISALWGAVSPADAIPAYRLSMGTALGRIGPLAAYWRKHLTTELTPLAGDGVVVDCRSGGYVAAWKPANPAQWARIRVERDLGGSRTVVSHHAKHARGVLAGHLALMDSTPTSISDIADAAAGLIGKALLDVELSPQGLTLVVPH
jgi:cytoplasmic iron level regulating protein YaaA (DUF328/UPF0246 family)